MKANKTKLNNKGSRKRVWLYRFGIFFALFLAAEIALRIIGYKPGVLEEFYYFRGEVVYDTILVGDQDGISSFNPRSVPRLGGTINQQGFYSKVPYTTHSVDSIHAKGKKVVFLVGDSYTHGCCSDSYQQSFAGLLSNSNEYEIFNFGIPGADPLQYKTIVEKYAPVLRPDLVVVLVYGGNDIMQYERKLSPYIPLAYPIKGGPWLNSEGPIYLTKKGTVFKSFDEAKEHYFTYFSLWSDRSSFFEKVIRPSIILSRPYLNWKKDKQFKKVEGQMPKIDDKPIYSGVHLERIQSVADSLGVKTLFTLIQSPVDIIDNADINKKYSFMFGNLLWHQLDKIVLDDYDGRSHGNHFNNSGHKKYANFLKPLIKKSLKD